MKATDGISALRHSAVAAVPDARPATLVIYVPVPLVRGPEGWLLEDQACNGLRLWLQNFERLVLIIPERKAPPPGAWVPLDAALGDLRDRLDLVVVPEAYGPIRFLRALGPTVPRLRAALAKGDYLGFAIGGLFGDWGAVCALLAQRADLPHYVWTDRVESEVVRRATRSGPWKRRLQSFLYHRPMAALERHVIRNARLGLFHGRETFDFYARYSPDPQVVHDIHIRASDHIPAGDLATKIATASDGPLRICYVGRADPMKGPDDWLTVLEQVAQAGVDFRASWLGEGTDLAAMRARVADGPLRGRVHLPGFVNDRGAILSALRSAHLLVFCHKTPESPRCLIEALKSGTPIAGYASAFPAELIEDHGGGCLTPPDDTAALAAALVSLAKDRDRLAGLIGRASDDGARFDDVSVFRHRSEIIRARLPRARRQEPA